MIDKNENKDVYKRQPAKRFFPQKGEKIPTIINKHMS